MSPRKLKCISKGLEINGFGIAEYSSRGEIGRMIELRDQTYYIPGSPKDFRIISPQEILTSEGYMGTFIDYCHYDHDSYAKLNFKEDKPG